VQKLLVAEYLKLYNFIVSSSCIDVCVLCGSQNKQRLFPYTALSVWFFITEIRCVYCAVRTECLCTMQVNVRFQTADQVHESQVRVRRGALSDCH